MPPGGAWGLRPQKTPNDASTGLCSPQTHVSASFATQTGLEPATFAVTGRRANQLRHWALLLACSQRDSNPRCRLERAES